MAEVVGGPIDLKVCENCPRKDRGQNSSARPGQAKVVVSDGGVRGAYISSSGRSAGNFEEHSTAIYMDNPSGFEAFNHCKGPIKDSLLQKLGFAAAACPALEELVGGDPADPDVIAEYIEQALTANKQ